MIHRNYTVQKPEELKKQTILTDLFMKSLKHEALLFKISRIRIELAPTQYG